MTPERDDARLARRRRNQSALVRRRIKARLCVDCGLPKDPPAGPPGTLRRCRVCAGIRATARRKSDRPFTRPARIPGLQRERKLTFYPTSRHVAFLDKLYASEHASAAEVLRRALDLYIEAEGKAG